MLIFNSCLFLKGISLVSLVTFKMLFLSQLHRERKNLQYQCSHESPFNNFTLSLNIDCHWSHDGLYLLASILRLIHYFLRFHALYQKDKCQHKSKLCKKRKRRLYVNIENPLSRTQAHILYVCIFILKYYLHSGNSSCYN